ncbi:MAG: BMC domain-containing protein [Candidatus Hodarchaeales archaeon]|jgi:microcompartment protein CcmL/EutN
MSAIGLLETSGRLGAIVATDVALKTANVKLISLRKASGGLITLIIQGDIAAVQACIDKAQIEAESLCEYITTNIIAKPANDTISKMINK